MDPMEFSDDDDDDPMVTSVVVITIVCCALSILIMAVCFPMLLFVVVTEKRTLTSNVRVNLITWLIAIVSSCLYCGYIVVGFRGEASSYSAFLMFVFGTIFFCSVFALSTSAFFVTVDRCIALLCPVFPQRWRWGVKIQVVCEIVGSVAILLWVIDDLPIWERRSACMAYSCTSPSSVAKINVIKLALGFLNLTAAGVFAALFVRYNKRRQFAHQRTHKRANLLAAVTLFSELFFNVIPQLIGFILRKYYHTFVSSMIGPYVTYCFALECFTTVIVCGQITRIQWRKLFGHWFPSAASVRPDISAVVGADGEKRTVDIITAYQSWLR